MSKQMNDDELKIHCKEAISDIEQLFSDFTRAKTAKIIKRSMLIAYWLKQYVRYLRKEDSFAPESVFKLKRGAIVRVEFGYRVGRELGGRHYAVVLDCKNRIQGNTVTVVPLGSIKEDTRENEYDIVLEGGIYTPVQKKLSALIDDAEKLLDEAMEMGQEIRDAENGEKAAVKAVQRQKVEMAKDAIERAKLWSNEIDHMKRGSVAKLSQITTISKMRISQPLKKTHPLYGVRLSSEDMDKIDAGLKRLYFPERSE